VGLLTLESAALVKRVEGSERSDCGHVAPGPLRYALAPLASGRLDEPILG